jgi:hypothetical protein
MVQMTVQVSDELAERCQAAGPWLSAIIDLSFAGFRTPAAAAASEIISFLSGNPSPEELIGFHISEPAQFRLRRLLTLNGAGCLSEAEQSELDELQQLEHFMIMLKARAGGHLKKETEH